MKVFITYGDLKFKKSRKRIIKEVKSLNIFDNHIMETEEIKNDQVIKDLLNNNKDFKEVFEKDKGGGYWIWKPYIIYKNLMKLNDNDILVYTDAGSMIYRKKPNKSKERFTKLFKFIENNKNGLIAIDQKYIEKEFTKGDIFDYFNFRNSPHIYNTTQYNAGAIHCIRKCNRSMDLYEEWWNIAKNNPHFFDDTKSLSKNIEGFKGNAHDQAVWSLLCKKYNVKKFSNLYHNPFIQKRIRM